MNEIIKVHKTEFSEQCVNAKELYEFLGYDKSQWSRWFKANIINDVFFEEGKDYQTLDIMSNGNQTKNFMLKIEMAKELAMLSRTEKGKIARNYFLKLEEMWNSPEMIMSRALSFANDKMLEYTKQIEDLTPKAESFDKLMDSSGVFLIRDVAKVLGYQNIGQNNLYKILKAQGVIMQNNKPYQRYVDSGYFILKVGTHTHGNRIVAHTTTMVTTKGLDFINKILKSYMEYKKNEFEIKE